MPPRFSGLSVLGKPFEFEAMQALAARLFPAAPGAPASPHGP